MAIRRLRRSRRRPPAIARRVTFHYLRDTVGRAAPLVYLQVWTGNRWLYLQAYVDSGAAYSVFHADVAQLLGLRPTRGARRYMALGNGAVLPVTMHRVRVRFAGKELTVPVAFSSSLNVGFNLLGRAGFFTRFVFSFNDRTKTLTVTPQTRSPR